MRIIFTRFPLESALGGAEIQTVSLMRGLRDRGHTIEFIGSCPVLLQECEREGYNVTRVDIGIPPVTKMGAVSFMWRQYGMMEHLHAVALERRIVAGDTVVMLSLSEKLLMSSWLRQQGVRVLWIEHDRVSTWLTRNPWLSRLRREANDATIVTVSDGSKKMYEDLGFPAANLHSIANGIDVTRFGTGKRTAKGTVPYQIGSVARLSEEKGLDVLIHAIADVPEADLTIIGEGFEEGYLRSIIAERSLHDRVRIFPRTDDLGAFYRSLDVFVLPSSDHDPFGLVAAEAMALGVPTIVTDACGIAHHCRDGHELLVADAGSSASLTNTITKLLHDPALGARLSKEGTQAVHERFTTKQMIDAYEMLLKKK